MPAILKQLRVSLDKGFKWFNGKAKKIENSPYIKWLSHHNNNSGQTLNYPYDNRNIILIATAERNFAIS